jgi:phenylalanyl-tRNA synthetase alpha chain
MEETINTIVENFKQKLVSLDSLDTIKALQNEYLGKKGELASIFRNFKDLSPEEKKTAGEKANVAKLEMQSLIDHKAIEFEAKARVVNFDASLPFHPKTLQKDILFYTLWRT